MTKCVFAGCFDPFTIGHYNIVERMSKIFDKVFVVVSKNVMKKLVLDGEQRFALVKKAIKLENVEVVLDEGLLVDFCKKFEVDCIVKGVRNVADFDYEAFQSKINLEIGNIETLFLPCLDRYSFVSSSFVREMLSLGKSVEAYVPVEIFQEVADFYTVK